MKAIVSLVAMVWVVSRCLAEGPSVALEVYALPMTAGYEVRSILTNTSNVPISVPTKGLGEGWDASSTGGGEASFYFIIGFVDLSSRRLVPSPERFLPVTLQPGESTELPMLECSIPNLREIRIVYVVAEGFAKRHGWWHGKVVTTIDPREEVENPYEVKYVPVPIDLPPGEEEKTAQPGATDNPDDAQRLREDH